MTGSDSNPAVAGGPARHIPVLGRTAVGYLNVGDGGVYIDATFGAGGYSREILAAGAALVIAIDRDPHAVTRGGELVRTAPGRLSLTQSKFSQLEAVARRAGHERVDGVVFDVGVSSMQLDEAARGFSFRHEGPLDMRMGDDGPTAAEVIAAVAERDLARIIAILGEERHARGIARAVVRARARAPVATTRALADIVAGVVHARAGAIHPATRTFQALRILVNDELAELAAGLAAAERVLRPGGRLVAVAFHSLEDRLVKSFLAQRTAGSRASRHLPRMQEPPPTFKLLLKRPVTPDDSEVMANPRARSAKLRAAERTAAAPGPEHLDRLIAGLPLLSQVMERAR
ncbi:MAG TPA: 16S rRNA (cytosine(1402)-N(4))-methyltransferase RsmH [Xanthobacteraceae bacterium]|jgi:16S rRNA (cytosine1402-N4)-methyltransferase